jgi:phage tail P2-like protein
MSVPVRGEHLLPPNASDTERRLAALLGRVSVIPAPIREVHRPFDAPSAFLPYLGWEWSLDIWDDAWSDERKRRIIARSFNLHRLKGTAAGMRAHVDLVDAQVAQIVAPPQAAFASRTLTKAEMDAWLRSMPQIRVYMAREQGSGRGLSFVVRNFLGRAAAGFDAGRARYGRAARLWDRGVQTPLRLVDIRTEMRAQDALRIERVSLPGRALKSSAFVGRAANACYCDAALSLPRIVTYRQNLSYEHSLSSLSLRSAQPGLAPVDVRSERLSDTGIAGPFAFVKEFVGQSFIGRDRAEWMMYDRIVLHDPARATQRVAAWSFADHARLGIPDYTAKVVIDLQSTVHPRAMVMGRFIGGSYAKPDDTHKQIASRFAVQASKALRDRVLLTHKLTRPVTFADGYRLDGSHVFGGRTTFRL